MTKRKFKFAQAVKTDVGQKRKENQDSHGYAHTRDVSLFVVADGMGGARGGATASALAVNVITQLSFDQNNKFSSERLERSVEHANHVIYSVAQEDEALSGMGTTLVSLAIEGDQATAAFVGDSRIYRFSQDSLEQVSRDHTLVQELVDSGAISDSEAENHPISHMLTRSLGPTPNVEVEVKVLDEPLNVGDKFLLCCDGVINHVDDQTIENVIRSLSPAKAAKKLVDLANQNGGSDNITVEVFEVFPVDDDVELDESPRDDSIIVDVDSSADVSDLLAEIDLSDLPEKKPEESVEAESAGVESAGTESAVDGLIFGNNPTTEDVKAHQEKYSSKKAKAVDTETEILFYDLEEEADEVLEKEQELADIEKVRLGVAALVLLSLGVLIHLGLKFDYSILQSDEPEIVAIDEPEIDRTEEIEELLSEPTLLEPEAPPATILVKEPTPEGPGLIVEAMPTVEDPIEVAKAKKDWGFKTQSIDVEEVEPEKKNYLLDEEPVENREVEEEPVSADGNNLDKMNDVVNDVVDDELDPEIAEVMQIASSFDIEEIQKESVPVAESKIKEIDWSKERQELEDIKNPKPVVEKKEVKIILTKDELAEVARKKIELRDKITNVDAKLRITEFKAEAQRDEETSRLRAQLDASKKALKVAREKKEIAERELEKWKNVQVGLKSGSAMSFISDVQIASDKVRGLKQRYDRAMSEFLKLDDERRSNSKNKELISKAAAKGREARSVKKELEGSLDSELELLVEEAVQSAAEQEVILEDLRRFRDNLNRQIGYLKIHRPSIDDLSRDKQRKQLMDDRAALLADLNDLRTKLNDESELTQRQAAKRQTLGL